MENNFVFFSTTQEAFFYQVQLPEDPQSWVTTKYGGNQCHDLYQQINAKLHKILLPPPATTTTAPAT